MVALLTCLMGEALLCASPLADDLVAAATRRGTSPSTFLATEMTDYSIVGLGSMLTGDMFISAGPVLDWLSSPYSP